MGCNAYIMYNRTKKKIVAGREFVSNVLMNSEPDGSVVICGSSVNCKHPREEQAGTTRAQAQIVGQYFQADPQNPNSCRMTVIAEIDYGSKLPSFVMRAT